MKSKITLWFSLSVLCMFAGCEKDLENAKDSLRGNWTVVRTTQEIAGGNSDIQTGNLGTFNFGANQVNYNYNLSGVQDNGNEGWTLTRELVNSGFVRVEKYTLLLSGGELFTVNFGDGTSDAEQNATEIALLSEDGFVLYLEK